MQCHRFADMLYIDFQNKYENENLIFLVENTDRLPKHEDRLNYLENLYMFVKATERIKNAKVWFIITAPNVSEENHAYLSAINKLSSYHLYLAPLSKHQYINYISYLLEDREISNDSLAKINDIFGFYQESLIYC